MKRFRQIAFPLFSALIWGSSYTVQARIAAAGVSVFTFVFLRSVIASVVLIPLILILNRGVSGIRARFAVPGYRKQLLFGGFLCGLALFLSTVFQQAALIGAPAGKVGFLVSFYIVLVPLLGLLFRRRTGVFIWFCLIVFAVGLWLLCRKPDEGFAFTPYDLLALGSALMCALHILFVDRFAPGVDGFELSLVQLLTVSVLSALPAFIGERQGFAAAGGCFGEILYAAVMSSCLAYTLQNFAMSDKDANPTVASLLFSTESVFAVLVAALFGERMTAREYIGCGVMLIAVVLAQLPIGRKKHEKA